MTEKKILSPCVHNNGTGRETLINEYDNAWSAVGKAIEAVQAVTVNGRDYYPYDAQATSYEHYQIADGEHRDRLKRLRGVQLELEAIINNLASDVREKEVAVDDY